MQSCSPESNEDYIRDLDSMARAVFTWVRQQSMEQRFLGVPVSDAEQCELAAGFLAGLKARFGLGDAESSLVAYVYALMRGERSDAATAACNLIVRDPGAAMSCAGYMHGLQAARQLLGEQHIRRTHEEISLSTVATSNTFN